MKKRFCLDINLKKKAIRSSYQDQISQTNWEKTYFEGSC